MALLVKNVRASWTWVGDGEALKDFNVAITKQGDNPVNQSVATAQAGPAATQFTFDNLLLNNQINYTAWVQAIYEGQDSDWVNTGGLVYPDDGANTLETTSGSQTRADSAEAAAIVESFDHTGVYTKTYSVKLSTPAQLKSFNDSVPLNGTEQGNATLGVGYMVEAVTIGTATSTGALALFIYSPGTTTWTLEKLWERGVSGVHPEFYLDAGNKPALRLYAENTTNHSVRVAHSVINMREAAAIWASRGINPSGTIRTDKVVTDSIAAQAIITAKIADAAISTAKFAAGIEPVSIVAALPNPVGYTGPKVVHLTTDGKLYRYVAGAWTVAVPTVDLTGQITSAQITDGAVLTEKLGALQVTLAKLSADSVDTTKLVNNAITNVKIAAGAVEEAKIALGAITTTKIADLNITLGKLAANSVDSGKLVDGSVLTTKIADLNITLGKLATDSVDNSKLVTDAVTAAKIAANAVTSVKIQDGAVLTAKIADLNITLGKLAALSVDTSKLVDAAVTSVKLTDAAVTAAKLGATFGGANMVDNSSFEVDSNADGVADGFAAYTSEGGSPTYAVHAGSFRFGGKSQRITYSGLTAGAFVGFSYVPRPGLDTTKPITISAWVSVVSVTGAGQGFRLQSSAGIGLQTLPAAGSGFVRLTATHAAGWSYGSFYFGPQAGGATSSGTIDIDGFQVEQGDVVSAYAPRPDEILPSTITATEIADNAITTPKIIAGAIVASKIAAATITANEIAALTIVAGNIAASTITGAKIAAGTITASNIQALTITAAEIAAGTITAAKIAAATITANEIAANAITASQLAANAVVAGKIAAGTIVAADIAANAITTSKLLVTGRGAAINDDPHTQDIGAWSGGTLAIGQESDSPSGYFLQVTSIGATTLTAKRYPIDRNKNYNARVWGKQNTGTPNSYILCAFFDQAGNVLSGTAYPTGWPGVGSYHYWGRVSQLLPSTYTEYQISFGPNEVAQIPVGATQIQLGVLANYSGAGDARYTEFILQEKASSVLIVDGSIIADKLAANAVTAAKILAGEIATSHMTANTIHGDRITGGTIAADKIVANSITAGQIAANAITTAKLLVTGRGAALNDDPACSDASAWGGGAFTIQTVSDGIVGTSTLRGANCVHISSRGFPVTVSKRYRIRCWARSDGTAPGSFYLRAYWFDQAGAQITFTDAPGNGTTRTSSWQESKTSELTPPTNAVTATILVVLNCNSGTGYHEVQDLRFEECVGADLIVDGSIIASKIATNAVTADKIFANSVTAAKIEADAVIAGKIAAGAIDATDLFVSGVVNAAAIATGAVTAEKIFAGAVTTNKLLVTSTSQALNDDPNCLDQTAWTGWGGNAVATVTTIGNGKVGNSALAVGPNIASRSISARVIPCDPARTYRLSAWVYRPTAANGLLYLRTVEYAAGDAPSGGLERTFAVEAITVPADTWTQYQATFQPSGGKVGFTPHILLNWNGTAGTMYAQDVRIDEVLPTTLIMDGAITTAKMVANTIHGDRITAGTITADKIVANSITAGQIASGAISTDELDANAVTAVKISAGVIATSHMTANTIDASVIAAGTISTAKLSATAIDGMTITGALIQTAGSGARIELTSNAGNGLRTYNGSGVVTAQLRTDGSGFIGPTLERITWDTAGAVTVSVLKTGTTGQRMEISALDNEMHFYGSRGDTKTGTYSHSGTTATVAIAGHNLVVGLRISLDFTSGTGYTDGTYTVTTVTDANNFVATGNASFTTSGNVTMTNVIEELATIGIQPGDTDNVILSLGHTYSEQQALYAKGASKYLVEAVSTATDTDGAALRGQSTVAGAGVSGSGYRVGFEAANGTDGFMRVSQMAGLVAPSVTPQDTGRAHFAVNAAGDAYLRGAGPSSWKRLATGQPTADAKVWVNFRGTQQTGTYSRTGTLITVTIPAGHGLTTGMRARLDFTTGTATDGSYAVTVTGSTTFTVTDTVSGSTSGNVTLQAHTRASLNVSSITDNAAGDFTINFATSLLDSSYAAAMAYTNEVNVQHTVGFIHIQAAGSLRLQFYSAANSGNTADKAIVSVSIFAPDEATPFTGYTDTYSTGSGNAVVPTGATQVVVTVDGKGGNGAAGTYNVGGGGGGGGGRATRTITLTSSDWGVALAYVIDGTSSRITSGVLTNHSFTSTSMVGNVGGNASGSTGGGAGGASGGTNTAGTAGGNQGGGNGGTGGTGGSLASGGAGGTAPFDTDDGNAGASPGAGGGGGNVGDNEPGAGFPPGAGGPGGAARITFVWS